MGLKTLYLKEVKRFWKVKTQTVGAPLVTSLLYLLVFVVAMKGSRAGVDGVTYGEFIAPGLVMMAILNNAFANASSSLLQAKMMGTAPDFLTPPLSPLELTIGFAAGAATRGVVVGLATALAVWPFVHYSFTHIWAALYFGVGASLLMGLVGLLAGLWSEKFDQLAAVTNFIVMPMTFLSGTFYLVDRLPEPFRSISHFNPFFYLIDGFRYGFIGKADGSILVGVLCTAGLSAALSIWAWMLFKTGWRLKS